MTRHPRLSLLTAASLILGLSVTGLSGAGAAQRPAGTVRSGHPALYLPPAQQARRNAERASHLRLARLSHTVSSASSPTTQPDPYPTAHLVYQGGSLVVDPTVYLIGFTADGSPAPASAYVPNAFATGDPGTAHALNAMFASPWYQAWTSQYSTPQYPLGGGTYGGTIYLANPAVASATTLSDTQITSALVAAANAGTLPSGPNVVDVLFFTNTQTIVMSDGTTSATGFCAYHNYVYTGTSAVNYVVMPDEQGSAGCSPVGARYPAFDSMIATMSHELAELITDPNPGTGWVDLSYRTELADLCSPLWQSQPTTVSPTYAYPVTMVWSNITGACAGGPDPTTITVTQSNTQLQVNLSDWVTPLGTQTLSVQMTGAAPVSVTTDTSGNATVTLPPTWTSADVVNVSFAGDPTMLASTATWSTTSGSPYSVTSTNRQPNESWSAPANLPFTVNASGAQIGNVPGFQDITVSTGVLGAGVTIEGPTGRYFAWTNTAGVATFSIPVTGTADTYMIALQPDAVIGILTSVTVVAVPLHHGTLVPTPKKPTTKKPTRTTSTTRNPAWIVVMSIAQEVAARAKAQHRAVTIADYAAFARRVPGVTVHVGVIPAAARFSVRPTKQHYGGSVCVTLPAAGAKPNLIGFNGSAHC